MVLSPRDQGMLNQVTLNDFPSLCCSYGRYMDWYFACKWGIFHVNQPSKFVFGTYRFARANAFHYSYKIERSLGNAVNRIIDSS
jgi:hypothetical protein